MLNENLFTSGNNEYTTPKDILEYFGPFDLDLCCTPDNKVCDNGCYCMEELRTCIRYGKVWCNPPYSTKLQNKAIDICIELARHGNIVYLLIPCRMNSKRFNRLLKSGYVDACYFPNKRLKFGNTGKSAPFDCMIVQLNRTLGLRTMLWLDL